MSESVYVDHVPELLSWPAKQRGFVSMIIGAFGVALENVTRGNFDEAVGAMAAAREDSETLRVRQRQQASRAMARTTTTPGLTAGQMNRRP